MANVGFKLGLQSALDTLITKGTSAGAIEGSFYLTSDTNRLYIGKSDGSIAPVNEGVITVANVASLPIVTETNKAAVAGNFYYATTENILCVYNGKSWVQINSSIKNTAVTNTVTTSGEIATVKTQVTQNSGDASANLSDSFQLEVAGGLSVSSSGKKITITGDSYTLNSSAANNKATLTLDAGKGTDSNVVLAGGTNVTINKDTNTNEINISSKDTKISNLTVTPKTTNGFEIKITDSDGATKTATLAPTISYGDKGDLSTTFDNGKATINVFSKDEVETKIANAIKGFNAMEYQGTIGTTGTAGTQLPSSLVKNGYSYLLSEPLTYDSNTYPAGSLVIAQGTEAADGYIPVGGITWTFVTGSNTDTTYKGKTVTGGLAIVSSSGPEVAKITAKAGTDITVTSLSTDGTSTTQELTIGHKAYTTAPTTGTAPDAMTKLATSYKIPVISAITTSNGHVTGYETKTYTVLDTNASLDSVTYSVSASGNTANITNTVKLLDANGGDMKKSGTFGLTSSSLTVTASGNAAKVDLVWGTF